MLKVTNRAGSEDAPGSWPWMASYGKREGDGKWTHLCGGTVVSKDTVLTAAHCFNGRDKCDNHTGTCDNISFVNHSLLIACGFAWVTRTYLTVSTT